MTEVTKVYQGGLTAGGATPDRSISACSPGSLIKGSGTIHGDVMQATGRASRSQLGALRARRVHRLERLVEPTNLTAGGIALWVGLHQQPARAILRDFRVVTLVIVAHRGNTASDAVLDPCSLYRQVNATLPVTSSACRIIARRRLALRVSSCSVTGPTSWLETQSVNGHPQFWN